MEKEEEEYPDAQQEEEETDEEPPEVELKMYNGTIFHVVKDGTDIYHLECDENAEEYGEHIGYWIDDKPVLHEDWQYLLD